MAQSHYDTLGVEKGADKSEIKKAYRRMANKHHPDKGGDAEKFKEVNEAYQVLSDENKRSQYDNFGSSDFSGMGGGGFGGGGFSGGGFGDIFGDFFTGGMGQSAGPASRSTQGEDIEMHIEIDFMEAINGVEKEIPLTKTYACDTCSGDGAEPGSAIITCEECDGAGRVRRVQQTILGNIATTTMCPSCHGAGKTPEKSCHSCHGEGRMRRSEKVKIKIPAGVDNGMSIRMPGYGEAGRRGGSYGDLYLKVLVKSHKEFKRQGIDIHTELTISIPQAVLGDTLMVATIEGDISVKVPPGTQSHQVLKLKNKGVQQVNGNKKGHHYLKVIIDIPSYISKKEKELYESLRDQKHGEKGKKKFF